MSLLPPLIVRSSETWSPGRLLNAAKGTQASGSKGEP